MKIEKLNRDNIKEFIRDMKLSDADGLELNVDKNEFYGVKKDDIFYLCFNSLTQVDTIAILYYNSKLTDELFYECINFLNKSLVVENHLIIEVYNDKYMKLFDDRYKCKEITVTFDVDGNDVNREDIISEKLMKEKFAEIEMKSIKYNSSKDMVFCNLVKQSIQDENTIIGLHNEFVNIGVKFINFTILPDTINYFDQIGYQCMSKSYVIRNDLF